MFKPFPIQQIGDSRKDMQPRNLDLIFKFCVSLEVRTQNVDQSNTKIQFSLMFSSFNSTFYLAINTKFPLPYLAHY